MITASICTIGDEILIGQIIDTNSSVISKALNSIGVKVSSMISIPDSELEIINTIENTLKEVNIIILTGGLGPTKDDITKKTLGKLTNAKSFIESKEQLAIIEKILTFRGIPMSTLNKEQALVPDSCKVILNECGTAPCMEFEFDENKYNHKCYVYSLPGVPFEAEAAIPKVVNSIKTHFKLENILHKTICTFGIAESILAQQIEEWENNLPKNIHLAYLPNPLLGVRLRLSIYGVDSKIGEKELEKCKNELKEIIGEAIYGEGEDSLEKIIGENLTKKGETISVAESCTGGFLASMFTQIAGSSNYFYGGVVSYDNSVKINILDVNPKTIEQYGAVSKECVEEMANGVKNLMKTDYSIATSGIAGPGGGSAEKPVGTVWVAVATKKGIYSTKFSFKGNRKINIQRFASNALNFFRIKQDK